MKERGYMSSQEDINTKLEMLDKYFKAIVKNESRLSTFTRDIQSEIGSLLSKGFEDVLSEWLEKKINNTKERSILLKILSSPPPLLEEAIKNGKTTLILQLLTFENIEEQIVNCTEDILSPLIENEGLLLALLQKGANFNTRNIDTNRTLISTLISKDKIDLLKKVLSTAKQGQIDFGAQDMWGQNLLHNAIFSADYSENPERFYNLIDQLIVAGVPLQGKDIYGYTPLDYALFTGNLVIAKKLTGQNNLELDTRFTNPSPMMNHLRLVRNIFRFIELEQQDQKNKADPTIATSMPAVPGGICNGWSFLAALKASQSHEEVVDFYNQSSLFGKWNRNPQWLKENNFKGDYDSNEMAFKHFIDDVLFFYQQGDTLIGLSPTDREKQVELKSDKIKVKGVANLTLFDLTREEQEEILEAYRPLGTNCIFDTYSSGHNVAYYQKSENEIYYFDPNNRFMQPVYTDFKRALADNDCVMQGKVRSFRLYHTKPEEITEELQVKFDEITKRLFDKFVTAKPERLLMNTVMVFGNAILSGGVNTIINILDNPLTKKKISQSRLEQGLEAALSGTRFEVAYVLYQKGNVTLENLSINALEKGLEAAIMYNDKIMQQDFSKAIELKLEGKMENLTPRQVHLMQFNLDKPSTFTPGYNKQTAGKKEIPQESKPSKPNPQQ